MFLYEVLIYNKKDLKETYTVNESSLGKRFKSVNVDVVYIS